MRTILIDTLFVLAFLGLLYLGIMTMPEWIYQ